MSKQNRGGKIHRVKKAVAAVVLSAAAGGAGFALGNQFTRLLEERKAPVSAKEEFRKAKPPSEGRMDAPGTGWKIDAGIRDAGAEPRESPDAGSPEEDAGAEVAAPVDAEDAGGRGKKRNRKKKQMDEERLFRMMSEPRGMGYEGGELSCGTIQENLAMIRAAKAGKGAEMKRYLEEKREREEKKENARQELQEILERNRGEVKIEPMGPPPKRKTVAPESVDLPGPVPRRKRPERPVDSEDGPLESCPF
ncbi:hypothetical protein GF412_02410 [Candidatus Micrarchaeota archaeon]|nr:hypothetical protein [Candidatus Micrarchaeota archaeon]MBD3417811.1 hypothetical protein [Candidatus Micrarchaeota archaeon]